jgi:site-specific DNA-cytosine methylase
VAERVTPLNVLDLFSGIGSFSLGLERAQLPDGQPGFHTTALCEIDPYCRTVLGRIWPRVPIYSDVRTLGLASLVRDDIPLPDILCGGFPCQDISGAGHGAGLEGARSGLWFEMLRIADETRPTWIIAENVPILRSRGLEIVLGGLASIGYDAWYDGISAGHLGASHRRDRIWLVASNADGLDGGPGRPGRPFDGCPGERKPLKSMADADGLAERQPDVPAAALRRGGDTWVGPGSSSRQPEPGTDTFVADANRARYAFWQSFRGYLGEELAASQRNCVREGGAWHVEPDIRRVVDGLSLGISPGRRGRKSAAKILWENQLRALGNGLISEITAAIGRAILRTRHGLYVSL